MTDDATPYTVPKEPGRWRAIGLAALVHVALLAFLWIGIRWQSDTPIAMEAEVWSPQPREAAPVPVPAPEPAPVKEPEPKPEVVEPPKPKAVEPPPVKQEVQPDIALEQEKKRKAEEEKKRQEQLAEEKREKERKLAEEKAQIEKERKLAEEKAQKEKERKLAEEKAQKEKERKLAEEKAQKEKEKKLAEEKAEKEKKLAEEKAEKERKLAAEKKRKQEEAEQQLLAKAREEEMRRITGGVTGSGGTGDAVKSQGSRGDASYAQRVAAKIKSNISFNVPEGMQGNPAVEYEVNLLPDGSVAGIRRIKSSGIAGFDEAVRRAIEKSQPYPKDKSGTVPSSFVGIHKPKDQ